jgi:HlyD family secretion protein
VAASFSAPTIFQIAQDLTRMQVDTNIDESDISRIQLGQEATFTVDAYPGQVFRGEVKQVRRAPINVQNVITYVVVIAVDNPDMKLFPGMTANVRILTDHVSNVVRLPSAALRVRLENVAAPKGKDKEFSKEFSGWTKEGDGKTAKDGKAGEARDRYAELRERFGSGAGGFGEGQGFPNGGRGNRGDRGPGGGAGRGGQNGQSRQRSSSGSGPQVATVYLMDETRQPRAERVRLGIGDGTFVAVLSPNLREGLEVITGVINPTPAATANPPGFPGGQQKDFRRNFKGGFPF